MRGEIVMEHVSLQKFLSWAEGYGDPQVGELTDNPAARIDFETDAVMARITYWSSGHCDAEIIDFDTEVMLYQKHWDKLLPEQLDHELLGFFDVLNNPRR